MPLVVQVGQDRTDEPDDGGVVGEDAHDLGPAFDLLVDPLQGVGAPDLADGRSPHAAAPVTPKAHHSAGRSPPKTSTHDRTPRDAYLAGR
jgi:hypothetical protein